MKYWIVSEADKTCMVGANGNPAVDSSVSGSVTIPAEVNGYKVVCIGKRAFNHEGSKVTEINLPSTITSIGELAFCRTPIENMVIPEGVSEISNYTFEWCKSLKSVSLPISLARIGDGAFEGCSSLEAIAVPNGVTEIGESAFQFCGNLQSIVLPDALITIKERAFSQCSTLQNITIPHGVTILEESCFHECTALETVQFHEGLITIGSNAFSMCEKLADFALPSSLTTIETSAFRSCASITSLSIPTSVANIALDAFSSCKGLKHVTIGTPTIKTWFKNNTSIETVTLGDKVTSIEKEAFYGCTSLQSVNLTENVTSIGSGAFYNCNALKNVGVINTPTVGNWFQYLSQLESLSFGPAVRSISKYAFQKSTKVNTITFSEGLETIGEQAFADCPEVTELVLPSTLTSVGSSAFGEMGVKELTLPACLSTIGSSAFNGLRSLVKIVSKIEVPPTSPGFYFETLQKAVLIVPKGCRSAYLSASGWGFQSIFEEGDPIAEKEYTDEQGVKYTRQTEGSTKDYYYQVTGHSDALAASVVIPASIANVPVMQIREEAFKDCANIQTITLPATLTYIQGSAFSGCTGITEIISLIENPSAVSGSFPSSLYAQALLQVPAGTKAAYKESWWKNFIAYEAGESKPQRDVTDKQGLKYSLTQSGDKTYYTIVGYTEQVAERVTLPTELQGFPVSEVSNNAFAGCTRMKWLFVPEGITISYKKATFEGCSFTLALNQETVSSWSDNTFLTGVEFGSAVKTVGKSAFANCTGILSVTIPENVEMTDAGWASYSPFYGCTGIQDVTILCQRFGNWFASIEGLKTVRIGSGVKELSTNSNYNLVFGPHVQTITVDEGNTVFDSRNNSNAVIETATNKLVYGCSTTTIPDDITAIGKYAFRNQTALAEINIPAGVTEIGEGAFSGCSGLQTITSYMTMPCYVSSVFDSSTRSSATLHVPYLKTDNYKNKNWSFTNIVEMDGTPEQMATISFADPVAKEICVKQWDRTGDGEISMGEAALVTVIKDFNNATALASFDELKHFIHAASIESNAFDGCTSLATVTLPPSITEIGTAAFYNCSSLKSVTIPAGVTKIGNSAFSGCKALATVTLPTSLTVIEGHAFKNCTSLTTIDIPEGVTTIGTEAFNGSGLTTMTIPSTVTSIGTYALAGNIIYCHLTTPISISTPMQNMSETVLYVPEGCEQAFSQADGWKNFIVMGAGSGQPTDWTEGVVTITVDEPGQLRLMLIERDEDAISRLKIKGRLNSEDLKYLVEGKGKIADLESLDLGEVTFEYGGEAYAQKRVSHDDVWPIQTDITDYYLAAEEQTVLPGDHVPGLGNYSMTTAVYGPHLAGAFIGKGYKHVVLPASVTKAAVDVFNGCTHLQQVEFKGGISRIDNDAFYGCQSLESVDASQADAIGAAAFSGCKVLKTIGSTDRLKYIGQSAFAGCTMLQGDGGVLSLPLVDSIPSNAFRKCVVLSNIRLSDNLTYIGSEAFAGCKTLKSITLPPSLTALPPRAFADCAMLDEVNMASTLLQVDYTSFENTLLMRSLPTVDGIKYLGHIAMSFDETSGVADASPATLTFREGTTSIADRFGQTMSAYPKYAYRNVTALQFPSTLKRIGDEAFRSYKTSSSNEVPFPVTTLTLPDGLEEIGKEAFAYAQNLTKLTLSEGLKKIGEASFANSPKLNTVVYNTVEAEARSLFTQCTSLEKVTIGPKVLLLPEGIFSGCTALAIVKSDERPGNTPLSIGASAFSDCNMLELLKLPANTVEIGREAFKGCSKLASFQVLENLQSIGAWAFYGCTSLAKMPLNFGLTTIGDYAFSGCSTIPSFTLPESLDSIGQGAFNGCYLLTELTVPASVTKLGDNFVGDCYNLTKLTVHMKLPAKLYDVISMSNGVIQNYYGYYSNWGLYSDIHYPDVTLYVPDGTKTLYRDAEGWKKFDHIEELSGNDITARNKLSISGTNVTSGTTATVSIALANDVSDFTAYQFDIVLPLGCTIATDANGKPIVQKGSRYADAAQTLTVEPMAVHLYADFVKYRFACLSPTGKAITGTEGALLSFPLQVSSNKKSGTYDARIENVVFTQSDGTQSVLDKVLFKLSVSEPGSLAGDANGDGVVNVTDAVTIVNYILGKPVEKFVPASADVNGDGMLNISDVVKVMSLVMKARTK